MRTSFFHRIRRLGVGTDVASSVPLHIAPTSLFTCRRRICAQATATTPHHPKEGNGVELDRRTTISTNANLSVTSLSSSVPSSTNLPPATSSNSSTANFDLLCKHILDIIGRLLRVPVPRLASMLCEIDEDLFESVVVASSGGLLNVCKQMHDEKRIVLIQQGSPPVWTAERIPVTLKQSRHRNVCGSDDCTPPPSAGEAHVVVEDAASPTQLYWDRFDVGHLIPYIPQHRYVAWNTLLGILPQVCVLDMPKEQRGKNIARCLRPFTDIVLVPTLMFRLNDEGLKHPNADPEGALMMLSDSLYHEDIVQKLAQTMTKVAAASQRSATEDNVNVEALPSSSSSSSQEGRTRKNAFNVKDLNQCVPLRELLQHMHYDNNINNDDDGTRAAVAGGGGGENTLVIGRGHPVDVVTIKQMVKLCKAYPTVVTTFTERGTRYFEALVPPQMNDDNGGGVPLTPYQKYLQHCATKFRQLIEPAAKVSAGLPPPPSLPPPSCVAAVLPPTNPCSVERLAQWLADTGGRYFTSFNDDNISRNADDGGSRHGEATSSSISVSELLSVAADILPINEDALITLAISSSSSSSSCRTQSTRRPPGGGSGDTNDTLTNDEHPPLLCCSSSEDSHHAAEMDALRSKPAPLWSRRVPSTSCVGCMPLYENPSDAELDTFITIDKSSRWSSLRKSAKAKKLSSRLLAGDKDGRVSQSIIATLRSKCPTTMFLSIAELSTVVPRDLIVRLPTASLLMFLDERPHAFEISETFTGVSTEYSVRVREIGEGSIPQACISPGTFPESDLLAFIDHAIAGQRGKLLRLTTPLQKSTGSSSGLEISATFANAWAKLPLSVRKQFRSNMQNFVQFLKMRPTLYDVSSRRGTAIMREHR
ncbi:Hypothetical protein, putative [Bodo saltans]|uniref:Uncharacterized protein n=1 Tax=Bodo saltans TaxID=75058 RepID=A0A0S4JBG4_BODSA|nr:Hypothetical protein, putative [Bodo saltans]|eukprot:CUG86505.1 Hypothetical protein, putative [Bodo saltans]